ncbi:hypothetical protein [Sphingobacterium haloxyli]|uniref:DUF5007 domain-containing protein n=1 Tax=Sphingobacterium haloxyli TaxID=2100533 RepID=A0A2S9J4X3_9SPHI|nr:hypothetical protein [Sphingobacterium haloxyli]PRD47825.1 hypothetical protein C5745_07875 [Sphingobacterium haloxyli]
MKRKILDMRKASRFICFLLLPFYFAGCTKTDYRIVEEPAYIRVFNNLTYEVDINNKEEPQPFFCMFIDPEFDETGKPVGGLAVGDFLDKRGAYAPPHAAHAGVSTSRFNQEYPGKELVPTAPILNGFDLTNWAQVSSGTRRFLFMSRPISDVPFGQLPDEQQRRVFLDTTISLTEREVYTIHVLQRDFTTKENALYVRQENFHKQPFSDTLSYVNFYNLSAKGFWQAPGNSSGVRDTMNVFLTHMAVNTNEQGQISHQRIPEFSFQYAGAVYRNNTDTRVTLYHAFPVFPQHGNHVYTDTWQYLQLCAPPIDPRNSNLFPLPGESGTIFPGLNNLYRAVIFDHARYNPTGGHILPGLVVNVHSGTHNPRTFGVVNSVEVVNGNVYLTTVQRRYPQPIY